MFFPLFLFFPILPQKSVVLFRTDPEAELKPSANQNKADEENRIEQNPGRKISGRNPAKPHCADCDDQQHRQNEEYKPQGLPHFFNDPAGEKNELQERDPRRHQKNLKQTDDLYCFLSHQPADGEKDQHGGGKAQAKPGLEFYYKLKKFFHWNNLSFLLRFGFLNKNSRQGYRPSFFRI